MYVILKTGENMIIRDPKQMQEHPTLPGMQQTPFDYIKQQNEIRKMIEKKNKEPEKLDKIAELKQFDNENYSRRFSNPLSSIFKKGK